MKTININSIIKEIWKKLKNKIKDFKYVLNKSLIKSQVLQIIQTLIKIISKFKKFITIAVLFPHPQIIIKINLKTK